MRKANVMNTPQTIFHLIFCIDDNQEKVSNPFIHYTLSKSKMKSRRLGGGDEAYFIYVEEADNDANKDSALI